MAYLGGKPFSGLSQRQIDLLRQISSNSAGRLRRWPLGFVYRSVGPVESYSASALLSAARQALWREGQFLCTGPISLSSRIHDRGRGHIGRQHHRAHGGTARLSGGGSLECRRDRRALNQFGSDFPARSLPA